MEKNILTNRFCGVLVCTIMLFVAQAFAAWNGKSMSRPQQDENGVFIITSAEELAWFSDSSNSGYKIWGKAQVYVMNARLDADLDMGNELFIPICGGSGDKLFNGTFDGNGHTISNLRIDGAEIAKKVNQPKYAQNVGLIAAMSGGTVKNLTLENVDIQSSSNIGLVGSTNQISVGAVVGWQQNGTIDGCAASGSIQTSGKGQGVGGIVGNVHGGTISNCLSEVNIRVSGNDAQVGGIVGLVKKNSTVTVKSCVYAGETLESMANGAVGAIVGKQVDGDTKLNVEDCVYDSDVAKSGVGAVKKSANVSDESVGASNVNLEEHICALNGGEIVNGECSESSPWSVGVSGVSLNGSDGFKVIFNAKSGAFGENAKTKKVLAKGAKITAEEISIPSHVDSAFAGWSLDENAAKPDEDLGVLTEQTVVYAVWYPYFDITFDAAMGAFADSSKTMTIKVAKGDMVSAEGFTSFDPVTDENGDTYYFTGWSTESHVFGSEDEISDKDTLHLDDLTATENMTLYASWTKAITYTVVYDANGHGKTKIDFVNVNKGEKLTEPPAPTPDDGYKYTGWCKDPSCKEAFKFDTEIDDNYVLYANWAAVDYEITYELNGGTNNKANPALYNVASETIVLADPAMEGAKFVGWFYDEAFTEKATQITQGSTGNKTLFAKWETEVYVITYVADNNSDGTASSDKKTYKESVTLKGAGFFTREGYTQNGWSLTPDGDKAYDFGATYADNADLNLYPHWVKDPVVRHFGAVTITEYSDKTVAEIDGNYTGKDAVEIASDIVVNSVTLNRSFNVNKISTLYVPFEIDTANVKNATVYKFKRIVKEDNRWKFKVAKAGKVMPNTPYVVLPSASQVTFDIAESVTLNTTTEGEETTSGAWEFKGLYNYTKFVMDDENPIYVFANQECSGAKLGEFVMTTEGAWSNPMRAYLVYHKGTALAKSALGDQNSFLLPSELDIEIEDENGVVVQTGKLNTVTGEVRMDRWFDLKGRNLNSKPTAKGTYYKNGKKTIIR